MDINSVNAAYQAPKQKAADDSQAKEAEARNEARNAETEKRAQEARDEQREAAAARRNEDPNRGNYVDEKA
jgi:hypothetical protein